MAEMVLNTVFEALIPMLLNTHYVTLKYAKSVTNEVIVRL